MSTISPVCPHTMLKMPAAALSLFNFTILVG